jgi:hypothetical protein
MSGHLNRVSSNDLANISGILWTVSDTATLPGLRVQLWKSLRDGQRFGDAFGAVGEYNRLYYRDVDSCIFFLQLYLLMLQDTAINPASKALNNFFA